MKLSARIGVSFFCYCLDLSMAIAGWCIGFGLTVQNWPALIGFAIMGRWIFHVVQSALLAESRKEQTT